MTRMSPTAAGRTSRPTIIASPPKHSAKAASTLSGCTPGRVGTPTVTRRRTRGTSPASAERSRRGGPGIPLCARSAEPLRAVARQLQDKHGGACLAVPADLNKDEDIRDWVAATIARFGGLDILVNNAGAAQGGAFLDLPAQVWRDSLNLKLFGCIRVAR